MDFRSVFKCHSVYSRNKFDLIVHKILDVLKMLDAKMMVKLMIIYITICMV